MLQIPRTNAVPERVPPPGLRRPAEDGRKRTLLREAWKLVVQTSAARLRRELAPPKQVVITPEEHGPSRGPPRSLSTTPPEQPTSGDDFRLGKGGSIGFNNLECSEFSEGVVHQGKQRLPADVRVNGYPVGPLSLCERRPLKSLAIRNRSPTPGSQPPPSRPMPRSRMPC